MVMHFMNTDTAGEETVGVAREKNNVEELFTLIARSLVDRPEAVRVNTVKGSQISILELKVAKEDLGKVIGKKGRTASALRTLLTAMSAKEKNPSVLEILE